MNDEPARASVRALTRQTQQIWDQNAAFWDEAMAEGNDFQRFLVGPATERLLAVRPGERVLDVACGNGVFARRLAALGAEVVASDYCEELLARARARSAGQTHRIDYRLVDATDEAQLLALGEQGFDAAVCNMALMDMTEIDPLMRALARLLKPGGRFVFSVLHPCFNSSGTTRLIEESERDGHLLLTYAVKVSGYLRLPATRRLGIVGQPAPHYYFDRPLSALCAACFAAGFVLDALEEPAFGDAMDLEPAQRPLDWSNFREIPPVLAARMRLRSPGDTAR